MADEIINRLGFDVSPAMKSLEQLDAKMAAFGKTMQGLAAPLNAFNAAGAKTTSALAAMSAAPKTQPLDAYRGSVERLTVSWEFLASRIVYTQMIVSSFGAFRRELSESVKTAEEFQRKIAEITTISDFSQAGAGSTVRSLSDQFNVPMLEEAAGLYQVLSNGITNAAEATNFLAEANRFARATNSDTKNSVDLLSGAVKGFGLSTDQTSQAAGVLFEAIRAGRITASELGNSFGRVGPRAATLGLSLEETAGALAAITVRGVKTSEAITQLGGILTALTKPTDAMTAALSKMGYSTGEEAIAALRLPGLLDAIAKSTDGSSAALAKMFPNVRGIAGELALTGNGLKEFVTNVKSMEGIGSNLSTSKYFQATATDAEKVTKEINKLSNALTVGFGQSVLKAGANLAQLTGGANTLIAVGHTLTPVVEAAGVAMAAMGAKALLTNGKIRDMAGSMGLLSKSILAFGAAMSVGEGIGNLVNKWSTSSIDAIAREHQRVLDQLKKSQSDAQRTAEQFDQARVQSALKATADLNKTYQANVQNIKTADAAMVAILNGSINSVVNAREKAIRELQTTIAHSEKMVQSSQDRVASLLGAKEDRDFEKGISGYDDRQKGMHRSDRALQMADQAAAAMGKAQTPEEINRALDKWTKAKQEAEKSGNTDTLDRITEQQVQAETKLQVAIKARKPELESQLAIRQQELALLKEQAKVIKENLSLFGKNGPLSEEEMKNNQAKMADALGAMPVKIKLDATEAIEYIRSQLADAFNQHKQNLPVDVKELERLTGKPINSGFGVTTGLQDVAKQSADLRKQNDDSIAAEKRIAQLRSEISQLGGEAVGSPTRDLFRRPDTGLAKEFNRVANQESISDKDYQGLYGRVANMNGSWNPGTALDVESYSRALDKLKEISSLQTKRPEESKLLESERFLKTLDVPAPSFQQLDSRGQSTTNTSTTTINFGDINVNGGETSQQTAREIKQELLRELRKGN